MIVFLLVRTIALRPVVPAAERGHRLTADQIEFVAWPSLAGHCRDNTGQLKSELRIVNLILGTAAYIHNFILL
jgi:hypothetical protein